MKPLSRAFGGPQAASPDVVPSTIGVTPLIAAAVIIAHMAGGNATWINSLAAAFVALRLAYGYFYITDKPSPRSLVWIGGLMCVVGLFVVAAV